MMRVYDRHIRRARATLFVVAGINLLGAVLILIGSEPTRIVTAIIIIVIAATFVALGFWTKKKPYSAILTALILYIVILALDAIGDPSTLFRGWLIKAGVIVALISTISNARETQRMMTILGKNK